MKHRIRAAALIVKDDSILLVQHVHPDTGEVWWVPPGGGMETADTSIFDCARRETFEETGLDVELLRIVYIRKYCRMNSGTTWHKDFPKPNTWGSRGANHIWYISRGEIEYVQVRAKKFCGLALINK